MSTTNTIPTVAATNRQEILPNAIYSTEQAAELVGVRPSTIRRDVRTGKIKGQGRPFRIRGLELFKLC